MGLVLFLAVEAATPDLSRDLEGGSSRSVRLDGRRAGSRSSSCRLGQRAAEGRNIIVACLAWIRQELDGTWTVHEDSRLLGERVVVTCETDGEAREHMKREKGRLESR